MALSSKLREVLEKNGQDLNNKNFIPVVTDAYLQGGTECVRELKELLEGAKIEKEYFNDAIKKIITDFLSVAIS